MIKITWTCSFEYPVSMAQTIILHETGCCDSMQLWGPSSSPVFTWFSPFRLLFPNLKTKLCSKKFESNEGIIDAVDEYLGNQEEGFYFEGISKLNSIGKSASRQSEIILRNNGTISALGHSQSKGAKNFWSSLKILLETYLLDIC